MKGMSRILNVIILSLIAALVALSLGNALAEDLKVEITEVTGASFNHDVTVNYSISGGSGTYSTMTANWYVEGADFYDLGSTTYENVNAQGTISRTLLLGDNMEAAQGETPYTLWVSLSVTDSENNFTACSDFIVPIVEYVYEQPSLSVWFDKEEVNAGEELTMYYRITGGEAPYSLNTLQGYFVDGINGHEFLAVHDNSDETIPASGSYTFIPETGDYYCCYMRIFDGKGNQAEEWTNSIPIIGGKKIIGIFNPEIAFTDEKLYLYQPVNVSYNLRDYAYEYDKIELRLLIAKDNSGSALMDRVVINPNSTSGEIVLLMNRKLEEFAGCPLHATLEVFATDVYGRNVTVSIQKDIEDQFPEIAPISGTGAGEELSVYVSLDDTSACENEPINFTYAVSGGSGVYDTIVYRFENAENPSEYYFLHEASGSAWAIVRHSGLYCVRVIVNDADGHSCEGRSEYFYVEGVEISLSTDQNYVWPGETIEAGFEVIGGTAPYWLEGTWSYVLEGSSEKHVERTVYVTGYERKLTYTVPEGAERIMLHLCVYDANHKRADDYYYFYVDEEPQVSVTYDRTVVEAGDTLTANYKIVNADEQYEITGVWWSVYESPLAITHTIEVPVMAGVREGSAELIPTLGDRVNINISYKDSNGSIHNASGSSVRIIGSDIVDTPLSFELTKKSDEIQLYKPVRFDYEISGWTGEYDSVRINYYVDAYPRNGSDNNYAASSHDIYLDASNNAGSFTLTPEFDRDLSWVNCDSFDLYLVVYAEITDSYGRRESWRTEYEFGEALYPHAAITGEGAGEEWSASVSADVTKAYSDDEITVSYEVRGGALQYEEINIKVQSDYAARTYRMYGAKGTQKIILDVPGDYRLTVEATDINGNTLKAEWDEILKIKGITGTVLPNANCLAAGEEASVAYEFEGGEGEYSIEIRWLQFMDTGLRESGTYTSGSSGVATLTMPENCDALICSITATDENGRICMKSVTIEAVDGMCLSLAYDKASVNVGEPVTVTWKLYNVPGKCDLHFEWIVNDDNGESYSTYENYEEQIANAGTITYTPQCGKYLKIVGSFYCDGERYDAYSDTEVKINGSQSVPSIEMQVENPGDAPVIGEPFTVNYSVSGWTGEYSRIYTRWFVSYNYESLLMNLECTIDPSSPTGSITIVPSVPKWAIEALFGKCVTVECMLSVQDAYGREKVKFFEFETEEPFKPQMEAEFELNRSTVNVGEAAFLSYYLSGCSEDCYVEGGYWIITDVTGEVYCRNANAHELSVPYGYPSFTPLFGESMVFELVVFDEDGNKHIFDSDEITIRNSGSVEGPLSVNLTAAAAPKFFEDFSMNYAISGWTGEYSDIRAEWVLGYNDEEGRIVEAENIAVQSFDPANKSGTATVPMIPLWLVTHEGADELFLRCDLTVSDEFGRSKTVSEAYSFENEFVYPIPGKNAGSPLTVLLTADRTEIVSGETVRLTYSVTGGTGEYKEIGIRDTNTNALYSLAFAEGYVDIALDNIGDHGFELTAKDTGNNVASFNIDPVHVIGVDVTFSPSKTNAYPGEEITIGYYAESESEIASVHAHYEYVKPDGITVVGGERLDYGAEGTIAITIPNTYEICVFVETTLQSGSSLTEMYRYEVNQDAYVVLTTDITEVNAGETLSVSYSLENMAGPFNFVGSRWVFRDDIGDSGSFGPAPVFSDANATEGTLSIVPETGDTVYLQIEVTDAFGRRFDACTDRIVINGGRKVTESLSFEMVPVTDPEYQKPFTFNYQISGWLDEYSYMTVNWDYEMDYYGYWGGEMLVPNPGTSGQVSFMLTADEGTQRELAQDTQTLTVSVEVYDEYGRCYSNARFRLGEIAGDFEDASIIPGEGAGEPMSIEIELEKAQISANELAVATYSVRGGTAQYTSIVADITNIYGYDRSVSLAQSEGTVSFAELNGGTHMIVITATDTNGSVYTAYSEPLTVNAMNVKITADKHYVRPGDEVTIRYSITGGSGHYSIEMIEVYEDTDYMGYSDELAMRYDSEGEVRFIVPNCNYLNVDYTVLDMNGSREGSWLSFTVISDDDPYALFTFDKTQAVCGEPVTVSYEILNLDDDANLVINNAYWYKFDVDGSSLEVDMPITDRGARSGSFTFTPVENGTYQFMIYGLVNGSFEWWCNSGDYEVTGGEPITPISLSVMLDSATAEFYKPISGSYSVSGWNGEYEELAVTAYAFYKGEYYESWYYIDAVSPDVEETSGTFVFTPIYSSSIIEDLAGENIKLRCELRVVGRGGKWVTAAAMCPFAEPVPTGNITIPGENAGEPLAVTVTAGPTEADVEDTIWATYRITGGTGAYESIMLKWQDEYGNSMASYPVYAASGTERIMFSLNGVYSCVITVRDTAGNALEIASNPITVTGGLNVSTETEKRKYNVDETIRVGYTAEGGSGEYRVYAAWMIDGEEEILLFQNAETANGAFEFTPSEVGLYRFELHVEDKYDEYRTFTAARFFEVTDGMTLELTTDHPDAVQAGEPITVTYQIANGSGEYAVTDYAVEIYSIVDDMLTVVGRDTQDTSNLTVPEGQVSYTPEFGEAMGIEMRAVDLRTGIERVEYIMLGIENGAQTPTVTLTAASDELAFGTPVSFSYAITGGSGNFKDFSALLSVFDYEKGTAVLDCKDLNLTGREGTFTVTPRITETLSGFNTCKHISFADCELIFTDESTGIQFFGKASYLQIPATSHVAFANDAGVVVPASVGSDGSIGKLVCLLCGETITNGVQISGSRVMRLPAALTEIDDEAFSNLAMQQITVPGGVTAIGASAFAGCDDLVLAVLPNGIRSIASNAFAGCDSLVVMCDESNDYVINWAMAHGTPICVC